MIRHGQSFACRQLIAHRVDHSGGETSHATQSGHARDLGRRFPVHRRLEIPVGDEPLLTAHHVTGHLGFHVVFERTQRALVQGSLVDVAQATFHAVIGVDVSHRYVRFFGFEGTPVTAVAGRGSVAQRQRLRPVVRHYQFEFALEVALVALTPRQPIRIILRFRDFQS